MNEEDDVIAMTRMLNRVRDLLPRLGLLPGELRPLSLSFRDGDGRGHRLVILEPESLPRPDDLALVAFFGQRRTDVSDAPLYQIDSDLVDDLREHPGLVSYSSLDLGAATSANLVLARDRGVLERWQRSPRHERVARDLAPRHYTAIRIHTGSVPGGLGSGREARIAGTRRLSFLAA